MNERRVMNLNTDIDNICLYYTWCYFDLRNIIIIALSLICAYAVMNALGSSLVVTVSIVYLAIILSTSTQTGRFSWRKSRTREFVIIIRIFQKFIALLYKSSHINAISCIFVKIHCFYIYILLLFCKSSLSYCVFLCYRGLQICNN